MKELIEFTLREYIEKAKDTSSVPGGGSIAGLCGALSGSLITMVYNLSKNREEFQNYSKEETEEIEGYISETLLKIAELEKLVDEDTRAFNSVLEAMKLPKSNEEEINIRKKEMEKGYLKAISVPEKCINLSLELLEINKKLLPYANIHAISDMGMSSLLAYAAIEGSIFNILINLKGLKNKDISRDIKERNQSMLKKSEKLKNEILEFVYERI